MILDSGAVAEEESIGVVPSRAGHLIPGTAF